MVDAYGVAVYIIGMVKVSVIRNVSMPFFPMRPEAGAAISTAKLAAGLYREVKDPYTWVCQPKLGGDRACLGLVDKNVYIQDGYGAWYAKPVRNLAAFLKLPNKTVLDGEVYEGIFYAFDALAVNGHSFLMATAAEREVMALHMTRLIRQPWLFDAPSKDWLTKRRENLPKFQGVVLKKADSPYVIPVSDKHLSSLWITRAWTVKN